MFDERGTEKDRRQDERRRIPPLKPKERHVVQIDFYPTDKETRVFTRRWDHVPRVGELVRSFGRWWRVDEVCWQTSADHDPEKAGDCYPVVAITCSDQSFKPAPDAARASWADGEEEKTP